MLKENDESKIDIQDLRNMIEENVGDAPSMI